MEAELNVQNSVLGVEALAQLEKLNHGTILKAFNSVFELNAFLKSLYTYSLKIAITRMYISESQYTGKHNLK